MDRRTATALLAAGAMFMEILDSTVITTALPVIAKNFHTAAAHLSLGVSAYLVALTVFIPISGWAAERFGPMRIFGLAIAVFCLSSALCALCDNLTSFTFARILQGLGGAMMVPVGRLVVLRNIPKNDIVRMTAILTWPVLVAPLLGPVVGGWIATHWSWQWIFLLNLPLGLVALIFALLLIEPSEPTKQRFDTKGFILSGLGFGLFMAGIEACSRRDISLLLSIGLLLAGILLLLATLYYLKQAKNPLFNLAPFATQTFMAAATGGSLFRIAIAGVPFVLPLMFQLGFGYSAVKAGSLLLWLFAGNLCMKPATTWFVNRFGFKKILTINGLMVTCGFAVITLFTQHPPEWLVILVLFVSGMNRSMQFSALNTLCYADIPHSQMRDANTLQSVLQQMNIGTGIAVGALTLSIAAAILGIDTDALTPKAFQIAFALLALLSLMAIVDALRLPKDAGSSVLKSRAAKA
ncbi:MFS transporter [Gallaecimonas mangrovi]|uniref:MFS transporter n=1 Tax=Gallaecimonas mangrovi TaxID=2291597 RepID=UPI001D00D9C3|nr:MFS transporter [Gallaecimonas mangrovi]